MEQAVVAVGFGGPEQLRTVTIEQRPPGPGEVAVRVLAAGVNPADRKAYAPDRRGGVQLPIGLGLEASGIVTAVGESAAGPAGRISVDDHVVACRIEGAYATSLTVPAQAVIPKPATLSWVQAASLLLAATSAEHALTAAAVGAGETVLVHGASGGVGRMAVQLARLRGAQVIATSSVRHHVELEALGASAFDYGPDLADRLRAAGVDVPSAAIDTVGASSTLDISTAVVADRRRIVTLVATERSRTLGVASVHGSPGSDPAGIALRDSARMRIVELAANQMLSVAIREIFPLTRAADAHQLIAARHGGGKVVLVRDSGLQIN